MRSFAKTGETMAKEETRLAERRDFQAMTKTTLHFSFLNKLKFAAVLLYLSANWENKKGTKGEEWGEEAVWPPGGGKRNGYERNQNPASTITSDVCVFASAPGSTSKNQTVWSRVGPRARKDLKKSKKKKKKSKKKKELIWCHILLKKYFRISAKKYLASTFLPIIWPLVKTEVCTTYGSQPPNSQELPRVPIAPSSGDFAQMLPPTFSIPSINATAAADSGR